MSNTAMTMPSRIWAWEIDNEDMPPNGYYSVSEVDDSVSYIRADIAEELARALFNMCLGVEQDGELPYDAAQSALTRYHNAIDTRASSV